MKRKQEVRNELIEIGKREPALLVEALATPASVGLPEGAAISVLDEIGNPALPAIRAKWADLNDERQWQFMTILEKHDPDSVREYVRNCLDSEGESMRRRAWNSALRAKDPKVKDRYFEVMEGKREETDRVRRHLTPTLTAYFGEERENKILIAQLDADSPATKGFRKEDVLPGDPWGTDGRATVILIIRGRKVADRPALDKAAAPALLKVLQEKGAGQGYMAELIIPLLIEFKYAEAVPELELIAASKPKSGDLSERHPYNQGNYEVVRDRAANAADRLKEKR